MKKTALCLALSTIALFGAELGMELGAHAETLSAIKAAAEQSPSRTAQDDRDIDFSAVGDEFVSNCDSAPGGCGKALQTLGQLSRQNAL